MPKSRTESVDEWEQILTALVEDGKIRLTPGEDVRGEAWRLAQQEEELASLRALAAPPTPSRDPGVLKHAIREAEALHDAAMATAFPPFREAQPDQVTLGALSRANAARAIIEALTPLHEQAKALEPRQSGTQRPPGDYCAACASRWCVCPDRQR